MREIILLIFISGVIVLSIFSLFLFLFILRDSIFVKIPFISTRDRAIDPVVKALSLTKNSVLFDLGCGNAKILRAAVRHVPGSRGVGIENGYLPYFISLVNTSKLPIHILFKDMLSVDISSATHIYCYLFDSMMEKLSPKILAECKKGTRIVSCDFQLPGIPLVQTIPLQFENDKLSRILYVYEVK